MSFEGLKVCNFSSILVLSLLVLSSLRWGLCQDVGDYGQVNNSEVMPLITQLAYSRLSNLTSVLGQEINNRSSFCIMDPSDDWNRAFNYSSNLDFLSSCIQKTNGDVARRLCTVAELKFYFNYLFDTQVSSNYIKPNKNCNLTTWTSGCEPGWACSIGTNQQVDLQEANDMPARTDSCDTCCEGFFCPHGLTCMIPCPLGSYCPLATLNASTSVCEPQITLVGVQTCGRMWVEAGRCSAHLDPIVQQLSRNSHVAVGNFVGWALLKKVLATSWSLVAQTVPSKTFKDMASWSLLPLLRCCSSSTTVLISSLLFEQGGVQNPARQQQEVPERLQKLARDGKLQKMLLKDVHLSYREHFPGEGTRQTLSKPAS